MHHYVCGLLREFMLSVDIWIDSLAIICFKKLPAVLLIESITDLWLHVEYTSAGILNCVQHIPERACHATYDGHNLIENTVMLLSKGAGSCRSILMSVAISPEISGSHSRAHWRPVAVCQLPNRYAP